MKETSTWISSLLVVIWFAFMFYMMNVSKIESSGFPIKTGFMELFAAVFWTRVTMWVNNAQRKYLLSL